MSMWRSFLAWLAALSADPVAVDLEPPRSSAAVAAAYATFAPDAPPAPPAPTPTECPCGGKCANGTYRPDGVIVQKCLQGCRSCQTTFPPIVPPRP